MSLCLRRSCAAQGEPLSCCRELGSSLGALVLCFQAKVTSGPSAQVLSAVCLCSEAGGGVLLADSLCMALALQ